MAGFAVSSPKIPPNLDEFNYVGKRPNKIFGSSLPYKNYRKVDLMLYILIISPFITFVCSYYDSISV
jgi:hypothetical protein